MEETIELFRSFLQSSQPHLVITADATGIMLARANGEVQALYESASLVTPDGSGVVWAAKRSGVDLKSPVSGVVLVERLCELSAESGARIFLLGAAEGVARAAAARLSECYPGCNIVGTRNGFFSPDQDEEVAAEISKAAPDILLVAMGMPRQEQFIRNTESIIRAKISMGVGGSLDVHSGMIKRAPQAFQKARLEWLWRLIQDPSKIAKVKHLPTFYRLVRKESK